MSSIEQSADTLEGLFSGRRGTAMDHIGQGGKGEQFILGYLYEKNSPVTPSEISDAMRISSARVSAALGALEKKGQIIREIDRNNRRNILVTITDSGRDRNRSNKLRMREFMITVLTEMGETDSAEFVRLIKRFFEISANRFENDQLN